ncbi:RNI-like protein [Coprinellus micaceus]|uniref:RNI-like protein n=1 Tax=Coprinellus micaceus TaxID=71717 RepID=A0A4Y7SNW2_COPMI|nr:RNI-like protein [Coprinellus micaceus]
MDVGKGKEVYGPSRDPKFASSIVEYLDEPRDVVAFSLVCKTFLHLAIRKIWTKPRLSGRTSFDSFLSTLSSPHHTVPYTSFITTIDLNAFADITDDQFRLLGACENLAHLDMRMCQNISAATLQHTFSQFHRLKGIDLEGISSITDDVILSLARNNPHLRGVKLGKCSPGHWVLSDAGVIALGDYCGDSLREVYLHLPSLSLVTSVALRCLITRCPRLQTLDIAHGRSVDDGVVRLVWQSVGQTLRKLNLAGCSELTDVMLPPPAPSVHDTHPRDPAARPLPPIPKAPRHLAPSLREIDLTDCKRLTDYAIELICTNAPKLRNLNLKGCRQLTDATLYSVAKLGSSLQQLNVAKLSEITDKGVDAISEACRKLANIDLSGAYCVYLDY